MWRTNWYEFEKNNVKTEDVSSNSENSYDVWYCTRKIWKCSWHVCFFAWMSKKYRQHFPKELSHLSLLRNIMYILIFSAQRECSNLRRTFSPHHCFFSIQFSFSFNPNQCNFFNPMQCYFWDVDCVAHNSGVLHFDGVVNGRNDGWYRRFTCAIINIIIIIINIIHAMQDQFLEAYSASENKRVTEKH